MGEGERATTRKRKEMGMRKGDGKGKRKGGGKRAKKQSWEKEKEETEKDKRKCLPHCTTISEKIYVRIHHALQLATSGSCKP